MPNPPLRAAQSGAVDVSRTVSMTPASITAPNANTVVATDAAFIGATAVVATFAAAPGANLQIGGAWVSNAATGAVTVRFVATGANYVSAAESIFLQKVA